MKPTGESKILAVAALVVAVAGGSDAPATVVPAAHAAPVQSRVVDQTFSCSVRLWAGARTIEATANRGFRDPDQPSRWKWLASASIGGRDINSYAWIAAGAPPPQPEQGLRRAWHWIAVDATKCRPTSTTVPLSRRGLVGGSASQFPDSDEYDCRASAQILVRVRGSFRTPVALTRRRVNDYLRYSTTPDRPAIQATVVVATWARKPLVYATVTQTGAATLFTAPTCVPD